MQKFSRTKYDEAWSKQLTSASFTYHGTEMIGKLKNDLISFLVIVLCVWDDLLIRWGSPRITDNGLKRVIDSLGRVVDIDEFLGGLAEIKSILLRTVEEEDVSYFCYARFKRTLKTKGRKCAWMSLLKPIIDQRPDYSGFRLVFRDLLQAVTFPLRVNPELWWDLRTPDQESDGRRKALSHHSFEQKRVALEKFKEEDAALAGEMPSDYIVDWWTHHLGDFEHRLRGQLREELFCFSSGATLECSRGSSACEKWDALIESGISVNSLNLLEFLTSSDWLTEPSLISVNYQHLDCPFAAKVNAVPKQWDKPRLITVEPTEKALLQKGLGDALVSFLEETGFVRDHFPIHDQSESRNLCLVGSYTGSFATIDLHSASDSVRLEWIRSATSRLPIFQRAVLDARSEEVEAELTVEGDKFRIPLKKYAGMGNRLTFPLEVLTFSSIVSEAIHLSGGDPKREVWLVYGDDIIIPTIYYDTTVALLTRYGFIVNDEKSYRGNKSHVFRESCGMWALDGFDVTPVLLSRKLPQIGKRYMGRNVPKGLHGLQTNWPTSYVQLSNRLYESGLWHARSYVVRSMKEQLKHQMPLFTQPHIDGGLWSSEPTNFEKKRMATDVLSTYQGIKRLDMPQRIQYFGGETLLIGSNYTVYTEITDVVPRSEPRIFRTTCVVKNFGSENGKRWKSGRIRFCISDHITIVRSWSMLQEILRSMEASRPSEHDENWRPCDTIRDHTKLHNAMRREAPQKSHPLSAWRSMWTAT
jgi:hypothetical protein